VVAGAEARRSGDDDEDDDGGGGDGGGDPRRVQIAGSAIGRSN